MGGRGREDGWEMEESEGKWGGRSEKIREEEDREGRREREEGPIPTVEPKMNSTGWK